jgi:hypothetical protein
MLRKKVGLSPMRRTNYWLKRLVGLLLVYSLGHGFLIWLATVGIHPEQWVASVIGYATNSEVAAWAWWILPAVVGLILLGVWEAASPSPLSARTISRAAKGTPAADIMEAVDLIASRVNINLDFSEGVVSRAFPRSGPHISWEKVHDGKELIVRSVHELGLYGAKARILAEPRYAWVINFRECRSLSIRNLVFGHTELGYCRGGVLRFENCSDIIIENCELFGSGTYALEFQDCNNIEVCDSLLRNCTYGIGNFRNVTALIFRNCEFRDNREFDLLNFSGTANNVMFKNCNFHRNSSSGYLFELSGLNAKATIYLNDSIVTGNTFKALSNGDLGMNNNKINGNKTSS